MPLPPPDCHNQVFNVLVTVTHGEYNAARKKYGNMVVDMETRRMSRRSTLSSNKRRNGPDLAASAEASAGGAAGVAQRRRLSNDDVIPATEGSQKQNFYMVVGFEVSPCSIKRDPRCGIPFPSCNPPPTCNPPVLSPFSPDSAKTIENVVCDQDTDDHSAEEIVEGAQIVYSYDVYWQESNIKWASRWDAYLRMPGGKVHWFSIMNSIIVVLIMATIVALILIRTVRRDLAKYEEVGGDDRRSYRASLACETLNPAHDPAVCQVLVDKNSIDMKDDAGWKLVTGDVFRAPNNSRGLAVQLGSGVQIILTWVVTLLLATLGFLSPAARGALLTTTIILYV